MPKIPVDVGLSARSGPSGDAITGWDDLKNIH
jgi:hypothetical protein